MNLSKNRLGLKELKMIFYWNLQKNWVIFTSSGMGDYPILASLFSRKEYYCQLQSVVGISFTQPAFVLKVHRFISGLFDARIAEYKQELASMPPTTWNNFREKLRNIGKAIKTNIKGAGDQKKKAT
jgi:hypothetical protein